MAWVLQIAQALTVVIPLGGYHFLRKGGPNILGGHNILTLKTGGGVIKANVLKVGGSLKYANVAYDVAHHQYLLTNSCM